MTRYDRLRKQAIEAASFRYHSLTRFEKHQDARESSVVGTAYCNTRNHDGSDECRAWVQIDTAPMPNGIDIGGPAVAIDCEYGKGPCDWKVNKA